MKKSILTALLGIAINTLLAQEDTSPWQIGITSSPEYAFRRTVAGSDGLSQAQKDLYDNLDSRIIGSTSGLAVRYATMPKLFIQIGAHYSLRGFAIDSLFFMRDVENPDDLDLVKLTYRFHYLDIPIGLYGEVGSGKFRLAINGGLSASFLAAKKFRLDFYSDLPNEENDLDGSQKKTGLTAWLGTGVSWYIHEHFHVQMIPTFRYMLTSVNEGSFKTYFWNAGVEAGVFYQF